MAIKCFVACAFEQRDVDAIFDKAIVPVLQAMGVNAERVDRIDHNDNLDKKIFERIRAADFCVVDLTYARPSVYFEAGYAEGIGKSVIYTARADHFRARDADHFGNFRVHFDLQMRNIIGWREPDASFRARFERRARLVVLPVVRELSNADEARRSHQEFVALALPDRCREILAPALRLLRPRGYRELKPVTGRKNRFDSFLVVKTGPPHVGIRAYCADSLTKKTIAEAGYVRGVVQIDDFPQNVLDHRSEPVHVHCVLGSMRAVPTGRIRDALPYHVAVTGSEIPSFRRARPQGGSTTVHVVSPIRCPEDFETGFRRMLDVVERDR